MKIRRWMAGAAVVAVISAAALAQRPTVSPAADMPGEWFLLDSAEMAAPFKALIGQPAPPLKVTKWFQGEVKPEATKGKVVILDIWATWCGPCKVAMPHGDELAKKYGDKIVYATICADGDESFVPKFIAEKNLSMPMAWDEGGAFSQKFNTQFFPTYVAIDKKGVIRAIGLSPDGVEKAIEKLLAEK